MLLNEKNFAIPLIRLNNVDTARSVKKDDMWFPYIVEQASQEEQEFVRAMTEEIKIPHNKEVESVATHVIISPHKYKEVCASLRVRITTTDGKQYVNCIGVNVDKPKAIAILNEFFQAGAPGMDAKKAARRQAFFDECTTPSENEKADRVIAYLKSGMTVDEVIALLNQ